MPNRFRSQLELCVLVVGCCLLYAGCTGSDQKVFDRVAIEGTVNVDGQPLEYGQILLSGKEDETQQSAKCSVEVRGGKFSALAAGGPMPGDNTVEVTVYAGSPPAASNSDDEDVPDPTIVGYWEGKAVVEEGKPVGIDIPKGELVDEDGRRAKKSR